MSSVRLPSGGGTGSKPLLTALESGAVDQASEHPTRSDPVSRCATKHGFVVCIVFFVGILLGAMITVVAMDSLVGPKPLLQPSVDSSSSSPSPPADDTTSSSERGTALFSPSVHGENFHPAGFTPSENRPRTVYGHIHIAKTAGTTVNGFLALNYERVCGNKGYSFMYTKYNGYLKATDMHKIGEHGKFSSTEMDGYGYEDCDYISWERTWDTWVLNITTHVGGVTNVQPILREPNVHYQLHLPCRDPVSHFLSRCNYRNYEFDCSKPTVSQLYRCDVGMHRFSNALNETYDVRCFNSSKLDNYFDYMDHRLQRKRRAFLEEYVHRNTNAPRKKSCLLEKENEGQRRDLERHLLQHSDYYDFCHKCMGSWQDLAL